MSSSTKNEIITIIEKFMDEMVERYTVFRELNINATTFSQYSGFSDLDDESKPNISFRLDGYYFSKSELKNYIRVFVDTNEIIYRDPNRDELQILIMRFLDDFMESHLIIENKKERHISDLQKKGYRPTKERQKSELIYRFSGIIPSREELEKQVKVFIEMNKL